MTLSAGLHLNVPMPLYVADPCEHPSLSTGTLFDLYHLTPAHARANHPRLGGHGGDDSNTADIGSAIHAETLQQGVVSYDDFDDWRTKAAREWRDAERAAGRTPVLANMKPKIQGAAKHALQMLATLPGWNGKYQVEGTMIWQTGPAWNRARFDMWAPSINRIIDIKTTDSANPSAWIRGTLSGGRYDIQAEHQLNGIRATGAGNDRTEFLFLLVEINPPHCCAFIGLGPEYSDAAKRKIKIATSRWNACMSSNEWPGYGIYPYWADLPAWSAAELEEQALIEKEKK